MSVYYGDVCCMNVYYGNICCMSVYYGDICSMSMSVYYGHICSMSENSGYICTVPITLTVHPLKRKNVRRKENTRETNKPQKQKRKLNTEKQDEIFLLVILAFPSCNSSSLLLRLFSLSLSLFRF